MKCPICYSQSKIIFNKKGYDYFECSHCKSIFVPDGIDQVTMEVGGEHEIGRNEKENAVRIERFKELVGKYGRILDWGAGHGLLVRDCKEAGLEACGYDKYNPDFDKMPEGQFNLCSLIETVEHLYTPFNEFDEIYKKLYPGGVILIESSYTDIAVEENIPMDEYFYINADRGHCTIFSHYGLDLLMQRKGYKPLSPINRNVRTFMKL